jgi:AcrR family transcriptional regulator
MHLDTGQASRRRPRTGGRSARVREAVLQATLDVLTADGYAAVSVPRVAAAAGVHSSTVYRRWGGRVNLVSDAVQRMSQSAITTPDAGDLAGDLMALLRDVVHILTDPQTLAIIRGIAAIPSQLNDELAAAKVQFWQGRFDAAAVIVERAINRGELPSSTEPQAVLEQLIGPAYLRALLTAIPLDDRFIRTSVARVIRAFHHH